MIFDSLPDNLNKHRSSSNFFISFLQPILTNQKKKIAPLLVSDVICTIPFDLPQSSTAWNEKISEKARNRKIK